MPSLVIKDLPTEIHERLKRQAKMHRRSMTQEVISLLETNLKAVEMPPMPTPAKGKVPLTHGMVNRAKREGRA
jgi:plasmid stability protein